MPLSIYKVSFLELSFDQRIEVIRRINKIKQGLPWIQFQGRPLYLNRDADKLCGVPLWEVAQTIRHGAIKNVLHANRAKYWRAIITHRPSRFDVMMEIDLLYSEITEVSG